jgi:hypothetical protein
MFWFVPYISDPVWNFTYYVDQMISPWTWNKVSPDTTSSVSYLDLHLKMYSKGRLRTKLAKGRVVIIHRNVDPHVCWKARPPNISNMLSEKNQPKEFMFRSWYNYIYSILLSRLYLLNKKGKMLKVDTKKISDTYRWR